MKTIQLFISSKIFELESVIEITSQVNQIKQLHNHIHFSITSLESDAEIDLKLKLLTNNPNKEGEKWTILYQTENDHSVSVQKIKENSKGVITINDGEEKGERLEKENWFQVRSFADAMKIVLMGEAELAKRMKMEQMLIKSQRKYSNNKTQSLLKNLAVALFTSKVSREINVLAKKMKFAGKVRLTTLRKYLNEWRIFHLDKKIEKQEKEIIVGMYLISNSNRKLLSKCFTAWKNIQ